MSLDPNRWKLWYRQLKKENPPAYQKAISYSESVALNHGLPTKVAAELEYMMVMLTCELLNVELEEEKIC